MHKLYEKTCDALHDLEHSDRVELMKDSDRRIVSELVDLKKNILKIWKMKDEDTGYSGGTMSMARKRDSMGRYSRDGAKDEMMRHLERAYSVAPDEDMRRHTRDLMDRVERA